jgi:pimeloyl-ACP methyl ester carboxylesterase
MPKRMSVGGLDVEYDEVGRGDRPFVLVHGFTGSKDDFADVLDPLATEHGRTLAPDLRGHGGTSNPGEGYSIEQMRADLAGFLDAAGASRCDLLGHSLGGVIALRLTLAEPERVASLVLMDTSAGWRNMMSDRMLRTVRTIAPRIPGRWIWRAARANRRRLPEPARHAAEEMGPDRYWERLRLKLEALDPAIFDELLGGVVRQEPVFDRLDEIRCPTTVVVGDQDQPFLGPSRKMADRIPDAKLVVIENAHHSPQIEAQEAWLEAISGHLERARS